MRKSGELQGSQAANSGSEWDMLAAPSYESIDATAKSFKSYLEQDTPDRPWQKVAKRQLNPNFVGALTAIGFATVLASDVILNGPSGFVVNHPEAATTGLTAGAAVVGAAANKLVRDMNAKELKEARQAERKQRHNQERRH